MFELLPHFKDHLSLHYHISVEQGLLHWLQSVLMPKAEAWSLVHSSVLCVFRVLFCSLILYHVPFKSMSCPIMSLPCPTISLRCLYYIHPVFQDISQVPQALLMPVSCSTMSVYIPRMYSFPTTRVSVLTLIHIPCECTGLLFLP